MSTQWNITQQTEEKWAHVHIGKKKKKGKTVRHWAKGERIHYRIVGKFALKECRQVCHSGLRCSKKICVWHEITLKENLDVPYLYGIIYEYM